MGDPFQSGLSYVLTHPRARDSLMSWKQTPLGLLRIFVHYAQVNGIYLLTVRRHSALHTTPKAAS